MKMHISKYPTFTKRCSLAATGTTMLKSHYIFFLLFVISTSSSGQTVTCDTIVWNIANKLSWKNFKAQPDTNSNFGALSVPSMGYSLQQSGDTINIQTYCRFLTCKSWTKYRLPNLLQHEQTHFDISELCRRTFMSKLKKAIVNSQNAISVIEAMYKDIQKLRDELNRKYDLETNLSRNKVQQDKWTKTIQEQLKHVDKYSDQNIVLISNRSNAANISFKK